MSRHINVSLALILGLVAALNSTPLFAMQEQEVVPCDPEDPTVIVEDQTFVQDCTSDFPVGLEVEMGPAVESMEADRLYAVQFKAESANEAGAYIPERFNSQAMVVKVLAGRFAFRVQGPNVIVDTQGQPLEKLKASIPIELGENPDDKLADPATSRTFDYDSDYSCTLNLHGQNLCLLDPADFKAEVKDTFVRLDPGDTVFLPDNSTCFLCNTDRIDPTTGQVVPSGGVPAELLIWTPGTGFNGDLESAAIAMVAPPPDQLHATRAWMFNPGSRCT